MRKKVFFSVVAVALAVTFVIVTAAIFISRAVFNDQIKKDLHKQTKYLSVILNSSMDIEQQLRLLATTYGDIRVTLISASGEVLYDNFAKLSSMGNHLDRPEVQSAIATGEGSATRRSDTLAEYAYYYAVRLEKGSVIRLSETQSSVSAIMQKLILPLAAFVVVMLVILLFIARKVTHRIVKPINELDIENAEDAEIYEELSPLIRNIVRLKKQLVLRDEDISVGKKETLAIIEGVSEGIMIVNASGRIVSINGSAAKTLNIKNGIGKSLLAATRNLEIAEAAKTAALGERNTHCFTYMDKRYQITAVPAVDVGAVIVLISDITDEYAAEQFRREFSANVSHELKTPLTTISGYAEMLNAGMVREDDVVSIAKKIKDESDRLYSLVNDIIKLSRLDEGAIEDGLSQVDLAENAEKAVKRFEDKAQTYGVAVRLVSESTVVAAVPRLVDDIIANILDNAIIYNRPGGSVTVTAANRCIEVSDTGIGIPKNSIDRVFERFYRMDKSRSKQTGGTGLGLSIVKHAAQYMGADISIESEINKGTIIKICF